MQASPPLHLIALATCAPGEDAAASPEAAWLNAQRKALAGDRPEAWLARWHEAPPESDRPLLELGATLGLNDAELIAVSLACAAETDAMVGRVLAWLQAPVGGARPTLGLLATLAARLGQPSGPGALAAGAAKTSGLLHYDAESRVLPEAAAWVPLPVVLALADPASRLAPQGVRVGLADPPALPRSVVDAARRRAQALSPAAGLVVRSGHPREARAAAAEIAAALDARAAFFEGEPPAGFGPWLTLARCLPVYCAELAPGERRRVPQLAGWRGPLVVASGPDGSFEIDGEILPSWRVPVPSPDERVALWRSATGEETLATTLGITHRHAAGRIDELARAGLFEAKLGGSERISLAAVSRAARNGATSDLGTLAELVPETIPDEALVLPATTRAELEMLAQRCLSRDTLAETLGPSARTRYRPGVRALLVGPSGTGKTLAAGWLATRLGLPLYRVDLASVTSKYIGETEKNLAQLFARAEHAEVVLLFDEADSLFGKRTDVKEANDRFANAQTNYLLSRIESYEGIAVLTSNSRARFDPAFTRRLDAIVEFAPPGPEERRALWLAHLGREQAPDAATLNRLAANCELAGGHIRNIVLAAAASARGAGRRITEADLLAATAAEYRKLGKPPPAALAVGGGA